MCGSVTVVRLQSLADRVTAFSLNCRCFIRSSNVPVSSTHIPVCEYAVRRTDSRLRLKLSHCGAVNVVVTQLDDYRLRRSSVGLIELVVCCSVTPALDQTEICLWSCCEAAKCARHCQPMLGPFPVFPYGHYICCLHVSNPKTLNKMHHVKANLMEKWQQQLLILSAADAHREPMKLPGWWSSLHAQYNLMK